jgi:hypothetical protein
MEGRPWMICRGFVARIPSAWTTENAGAKTFRCVTTMGRRSSVGCCAAALAKQDFPSGKGRHCLVPSFRTRSSARYWSTLTKAVASAKAAAWWVSIATR